MQEQNRLNMISDEKRSERSVYPGMNSWYFMMNLNYLKLNGYMTHIFCILVSCRFLFKTNDGQIKQAN